MPAIRYAARANLDLAEIAAYVAGDNPERARALVARIRERCQRLRTFPQCGRPRPELGPGVRSVGIGRIGVYYRVRDRGRVVEILRVLHGSRDIARAFLSPLIAPAA